MNNQFFSIGITKESPVTGGFMLEFAASGKDQNSSFVNGFAGINFQRPRFEIKEIAFSGLNTLNEGDGIDPVVNQVNFTLNISGEIPDDDVFESNNSGAFNVERILVFTGESREDIEVVGTDFSDFIISTEIDENFDINFSLTSEQLNNNTGVIFYRFLPFDRIGTGKISDIISGSMFTGFADLGEAFTEEIFISRSNLNDLRFDGKLLLLSDGATGIRIDNAGITPGFSCAFELRTDQEVVITGIDTTVTFVKPPDVTIPTTGATMSGNFERFSLQKDTQTANNYIVRKSQGGA